MQKSIWFYKHLVDLWQDRLVHDVTEFICKCIWIHSWWPQFFDGQDTGHSVLWQDVKGTRLWHVQSRSMRQTEEHVVGKSHHSLSAYLETSSSRIVTGTCSLSPSTSTSWCHQQHVAINSWSCCPPRFPQQIFLRNDPSAFSPESQKWSKMYEHVTSALGSNEFLDVFEWLSDFEDAVYLISTWNTKLPKLHSSSTKGLVKSLIALCSMFLLLGICWNCHPVASWSVKRNEESLAVWVEIRHSDFKFNWNVRICGKVCRHKNKTQFKDHWKLCRHEPIGQCAVPIHSRSKDPCPMRWVSMCKFQVGEKKQDMIQSIQSQRQARRIWLEHLEALGTTCTCFQTDRHYL